MIEEKLTAEKREASIIAIITVGLIASIGFVVLFVVSRGFDVPKDSGSGGSPGIYACPEIAKQCPDGSYVGATGPNCDFVCPVDGLVDGGGSVSEGVNQGGKPCSSNADCSKDEACINPSPVIRSDEQGQTVCWPKNQPTPICLSEGTRIATPQGDRFVEDLQAGDMVFSQDEKGNKIVVPIAETTRTETPLNHMIIDLTLEDGKEVKASPHHPLADGREIGSIEVGDMVDGSIVRTVSQEAYKKPYTYDILPESDTGTYWADGILLSSTLK